MANVTIVREKRVVRGRQSCCTSTGTIFVFALWVSKVAVTDTERKLYNYKLCDHSRLGGPSGTGGHSANVAPAQEAHSTITVRAIWWLHLGTEITVSAIGDQPGYALWMMRLEDLRQITGETERCEICVTAPLRNDHRNKDHFIVVFFEFQRVLNFFQNIWNFDLA